jgi:hypothetical protein
LPEELNGSRQVLKISIRRSFANLLPRISIQDRSAIPRRIIRKAE